MGKLIFKLIHITDDNLVFDDVEMILQRRNGQDRGLSLLIHIDHRFRHDVRAGNPGMAVAAVALPEIGCAFCQILETRSAGKQQSIQTGLLKCFKTSFSSFGHEHGFSPLHDEYVFLILSILSFGQDQRYERIQKNCRYTSSAVHLCFLALTVLGLANP